MDAEEFGERSGCKCVCLLFKIKGTGDTMLRLLCRLLTGKRGKCCGPALIGFAPSRVGACGFKKLGVIHRDMKEIET